MCELRTEFGVVPGASCLLSGLAACAQSQRIFEGSGLTGHGYPVIPARCAKPKGTMQPLCLLLQPTATKPVVNVKAPCKWCPPMPIVLFPKKDGGSPTCDQSFLDFLVATGQTAVGAWVLAEGPCILSSFCTKHPYFARLFASMFASTKMLRRLPGVLDHENHHQESASTSISA